MTALIITFILLLVVGAPIFFAVGISASAFVLSSGNNSLAIITQKMVDGIISTTLMALPLFIYSGNLMSCCATQRLMRFADMILGKIPGGLGTEHAAVRRSSAAFPAAQLPHRLQSAR